MIIIKSLEEIEDLRGNLITINNEYLYILQGLYGDSKDLVVSIDSQFVRTYLRFQGIRVDLLTGLKIFTHLLEKSSRKVLVLGGGLRDSRDKFDFEVVNLPIGSVEDLYAYLVSNSSKELFNDYVVCVMLGAEKQELLITKLLNRDYFHCSNSLFIGMGGTLDQYLGKQYIPGIISSLHLTWLWRSVVYFDRTKLLKIIRSIVAFKYYRAFIK